MTIDLKAGIVRVLKSNGETSGTGFVVSDDGLIATCAHVVEAAGVGPGDTVRIVYHATGEEREAQVESEYWRASDAEDVAILRAEGALPGGVTALLLGSSGSTSGHPFKTFGFPDASPEEGIWGDGHILEATKMQGVQVLQLSSPQITPGFSGAPVWDERTRRVVGMVTSIAAPDRYGRLTETAFITPTETLQVVCPALQISDVCPYRSLDAFTEDDAEFFFGRQRVVDRLLESLRREPRFLAVLGPSGSGKSSLMQAGLISQLRQGAVPGSDRWGVIVARPADQPFGQLEARGLAGASKGLVEAVQAWLDHPPEQERLVLVVDQLEELLVTCPEALLQAFVAQLMALLEASVPVTVVLVMRNDFYSRFAQEAPDLLSWLERGLVNVLLTLERDELSAIVEEPARVVGLSFETGLVEAILEDAMESAPEGEGRVGRSTVLPLLEFALTQLWERRQDGVLTHEAYQAIGGVTGGLTQWADRAFYGLEEEQQRLARRVLTDLVHLGDESQGLPDSRRRRPLDALCRDEGEREAIHQVVQRLADARLLVTGRDLQSGQETVELIHDALLREWGLLQGWLREDRRFLAWRQAMEGRLQAWEAKNQDAGTLLRGALLAEAEEWLAEREDYLNAEERAYIRESVALRERERAERERRRRRFSMAAVGAAVVFSTLAVVVGILWWRSEEQRRIAVTRQLAAQSQMAGSNTGADLVRGVLLAVESLRRIPSLEAEQALRRWLALARRPVARITQDQAVLAVAFNSDGQRIATGSIDGTVRIWEWVTGQEVLRLQHDGYVEAVAFSRDGRWIATGSKDHTARVWRMDSGQEVARIKHEGPVWTVAFSPDGRWVASGSGEGYSGQALVWEVETAREVARMMHERPVWAAAFSPDGHLLATGCDDRIARVWEITTEQEVARVTHGWMYPIYSVDFSPDGRWLATASEDRTVRVWEVATGKEIARVAQETPVRAVAFGPGGAHLAIGSWDGTALVWNVVTGQEVARMIHEGPVVSVAFSSNGRWVLTGSHDATARVWEVAAGEEVAQVEHEQWLTAVVFSPDGRWVASGSWDGTVQVWRAATGEKVAQMTREFGVDAVVFSPDGRWLVTNSAGTPYGGGTAYVWEAATGEEITRVPHEGYAETVVFSPDGQWVASADSCPLQACTPTVRVWEAATGHEISRMAHEGYVETVVFSPDGQWVASADSCPLQACTPTVRVWEAATGHEISRMAHEANIETVAFSPDSRWLATGSSDGTVWVWEATKGREVARMVHEDKVSSVAFSPDGRWVASGSYDNTARVWDIATEQEVARMMHGDWVSSMAFSPDGQWLVSGSGDHTVRVWEVVEGREVARMVHEDSVSSVAFSPDGRWVASGSYDNTARVWLWRLEDLITEACSRLPRNLTLEEWRQYLGNEPYRPTCPNLPVPGE